MKVGISINGVLRDLFSKIEETHDKYFPSENEEDIIKVEDYDFDKWVVFPDDETEQDELSFDPDFKGDGTEEVEQVTETISVKEETTVEEFLYERCTVEVFGYANEYPSSMASLNSLYLDQKDNHEFIVMSREIGPSVPSTYFFLSKTSCQIRDVKFISENKDHWNHVDVMITDHPDILSSKPEGKISIKVEKPFNKDIESDYTIESLKGIQNHELWDTKSLQ